MDAEAAVKKLAKLPGNTICPNCGTQKKFGFGTVCIKYLTFVCNECKSSHQAISHRCKSLTMSSWTMEEVQQLQHQGGNDRARATWLAHAPPYGHGGRPCAGSDLAVFKRFVVEAYEHKKYYGSSNNNSSDVVGVDHSATVTSTATATIAAAVQQQSQPRAVAPRQPVVAPTPVAAPVTDLLDFGAFENAAAPAPVSNEGVSVFAPFQQPQSSSSAPAAVVATPAPSTTMDLFASNNTSGGIVATAAGNSTVASATDPFGGFDPFTTTASTASTTTTKPPVMRNHNSGSAVMNPNTISTGMPNQMNGMAPMGGMSGYNNNNNNAFLGMPMNATSSGNSIHSQGFGFVSQPQQSQFMPTHQNTPMGMTMGLNHSNLGMMNGTTVNGFGNFNAGSGMGPNNNSNGMMMTMMSMPTSGFPNAVGGINQGLHQGFQYGGGSVVPQQQRQSSSYTNHNSTGASSKPDPFAGLGL